MSVWDIVLTSLLGLAATVISLGTSWLVPRVGDWLRTRSDQQWLQTLKDQAILLVDQLDQYIENGSSTSSAARAVATSSIRSAITANGGEKRAHRVAGVGSSELAETVIEAAVRQRQPAKAHLKNLKDEVTPR